MSSGSWLQLWYFIWRFKNWLFLTHITKQALDLSHLNLRNLGQLSQAYERVTVSYYQVKYTFKQRQFSHGTNEIVLGNVPRKIRKGECWDRLKNTILPLSYFYFVLSIHSSLQEHFQNYNFLFNLKSWNILDNQTHVGNLTKSSFFNLLKITVTVCY